MHGTLYLFTYLQHTVFTVTNFTITVEVINRFPSHLAHNVSDKFLTVRHKDRPLHLVYTRTLPFKTASNCDKSSIMSRCCFKKTRGLRQKNVLSALYTSFTFEVFKVFTTRFNTHYQMVTSLLYCTYMMAWSGVTSSLNSREYCVYYICNVRSDRMALSTNFLC